MKVIKIHKLLDVTRDTTEWPRMGRAGWARWPRGRPGPPNVQRRPATATRPADSGRSEAGHLPMLENPHQPGDPTPDKRKVDKRTAAGGHVHGPNGPRRPPHAPPRPARPAHPPPHKRPHTPPDSRSFKLPANAGSRGRDRGKPATIGCYGSMRPGTRGVTYVQPS